VIDSLNSSGDFCSVEIKLIRLWIWQRNVPPSALKNLLGRDQYLVMCAFLDFNPLTLELNPSAQRCLTRLFYWGFFFLNRAFP
jgi:hypothetical protein